ncbi:MAG TPA: ThiF family adenylyltransferase [Patescibacteria group bacterium]|nr:ThiF family adenylyltransferase [Patescibacteria group bacterium]
MNIEEQLKKINIEFDSHPAIFDLGNEKDQKIVAELFDQKKILSVMDDYKEQLHELFAIKNPTLVYAPDFEKKFDEYYSTIEKEKSIQLHGKWVYFPWLFNLVHILDKEDFLSVRTARNRYLIDPEEQSKFYNTTIGIAGLSVGNSVALAIVMQGGGGRLKLADFDRFALTNTNRIRAGIENLGLRKVEMAARQIYCINPYTEIDLFYEGLTDQNIEKFFGDPKLDIVIDELDSMAIKLRIREYAKKYKIAVAMGADNGDNAIIDIERYDLDSNIKPFQGRLGDITYDELNNLDKFGVGKTITKFLGPENITERMLYSLSEMGKSIVSWPQLGGAALLNGIAVAYCVRKILNKQSVIDNRSLMIVDELLDPDYNSEENKKRRAEKSDKFKQMFNL